MPRNKRKRVNLGPETRKLLEVALKRHYDLCHFYGAPWDHAIKQICEEIEQGELELGEVQQELTEELDAD